MMEHNSPNLQDFGPYIGGGATTIASSTPTIWYFPYHEIRFTPLSGILVPSKITSCRDGKMGKQRWEDGQTGEAVQSKLLVLTTSI